MRRAGLYLALVALASLSLAFCSARVGAQQPNYDFAARRWDNPIGIGGWYMRRYEWHAFYASSATLCAEFVHRSTGLARIPSALSCGVGMGLVPHVVGLARHQYAFDARDWTFDLVNRSAPVILWTGTSGKTWQSKTLAFTTIVAAYFATAPFASP
jgi:hypothetical protein